MALHVFQGSYTFASPADVRDALAAVADVVSDEDQAFRQAWRAGRDGFLRPDGATVVVDVSLRGPDEWWDVVASLVDELADEARTGKVTSTTPEGDVVVIDAEEIVAGDPDEG